MPFACGVVPAVVGALWLARLLLSRSTRIVDEAGVLEVQIVQSKCKEVSGTESGRSGLTHVELRSNKKTPLL